MPVLRLIPTDPFDLVLQGEQMRAAAFAQVVGFPVAMVPVLEGDQGAFAVLPYDVVAGQKTLGSMVGGDPMPNVEVLRDACSGTMMAANAGIVTPCGAWVPTRRGNVMLETFVESSVLFAFVGTTRDSVGSALGSCRVIARDEGRTTIDGVESYVGETTSDGSGAYTLPVGLNTAYQLTAYKVGSPDVAGISANTVTPTAIG